ncbi:hypothetical protein GQR58_004165 [Nymphon striatum]|nr:hypothetical protein GQR58_004165 [Nymphon striatum]
MLEFKTCESLLEQNDSDTGDVLDEDTIAVSAENSHSALKEQFDEQGICVEAALYIAKLRASSSMTMSGVSAVTENVSSMVSNIVDHLKTITVSGLDQAQQSSADIPTIKKHIEDTFTSFSNSLSPGVWDAVQSYIPKADCVLRDFHDGEYYNSHNLLPTENCISIGLNNDDMETANPLGTHATVHKLGFFYYIVKNLPPVFNSSLNNCFLMQVYYSSDKETAITFSDDDCVHAEKHFKMSTGFKSIRKAHTKNVLTPERSSTPLSSDEEIAMSKFPAKSAARPPPQGSLGQRDPHTPIQMRERISATPRPANQPSPIVVRNLLDETFPDKWIGRRGPIEFPPRSPDITPMDFFVWGVIKDSVYSRKPRSVEDLRQFVIDAFANLDRDLCTKVCHSVVSRCRECIEAEGLQFEYLSYKLFALIVTVFSDSFTITYFESDTDNNNNNQTVMVPVAVATISHDALSTANVVKRMDSLFDCFNSSNMYNAKPFKCALKNDSIHHDFLDEYDQGISPFTRVTGEHPMVPRVVATEDSDPGFLKQTLDDMIRMSSSRIPKELQSYVPKDLQTCTHVGLRVDRSVLESGLSVKDMIQVSMGGPNVNWKFYDDLKKKLVDDYGISLINIGSCGTLCTAASREEWMPQTEKVTSTVRIARHISQIAQIETVPVVGAIGQSDVTLLLNADGVSVFKSSNYSVWPILATINELPPHLRRQHIIMGGLWFRSSKPTMNTFLKPFTDELFKLGTMGFQTRHVNRKAFVLALSADAPARAIIRNCKQFNGAYGCDWCVQEGTAVPNANGPPIRTYPYMPNIPLRTNDGQRRLAVQSQNTEVPQYGVKGPSIVMLLPRYDCAKGTFAHGYVKPKHVLLGENLLGLGRGNTTILLPSRLVAIQALVGAGVNRSAMSYKSNEKLMKVDVFDKKLQVNYKKVDIGYASEKLKSEKPSDREVLDFRMQYHNSDDDFQTNLTYEERLESAIADIGLLRNYSRPAKRSRTAKQKPGPRAKVARLRFYLLPDGNHNSDDDFQTNLTYEERLQSAIADIGLLRNYSRPAKRSRTAKQKPGPRVKVARLRVYLLPDGNHNSDDDFQTNLTYEERLQSAIADIGLLRNYSRPAKKSRTAKQKPGPRSKGVKNYGVPSRKRADHGTEYADSGWFMISVNGEGRGSFMTGPSVHNQRIERLWRDIFIKVIDVFYKLFCLMEEQNILNTTNSIHRRVLQYVFTPRIDFALREWMNTHNNHKIRTEVIDVFYKLFRLMEEQNILDTTKSIHRWVLQFIFTPRIDFALREWMNTHNNHKIRTEGNQTPNMMWFKSLLLGNPEKYTSIRNIENPPNERVDEVVHTLNLELNGTIFLKPRDNCPLTEDEFMELRNTIDITKYSWTRCV